MSVHGFCQNGKCKAKASVRLNVPTNEKGRKHIDLCAPDAAYFLELRENEDRVKQAEKFVESCHEN